MPENFAQIVTSTIDPFSPEFLSQVQQVADLTNVRENPINAKPKRRALTPKFYLSKPLIKRLEKLISTTVSEPVKEIANALLNKKRQEDSPINYLGLSRDDFSKISYMDNDRIDRYKDQSSTKTYLKSGCTLKVTYQQYNYRTSLRDEVTERLKLTSSHINTPIVCYQLPDGDYYAEAQDCNLFYSRNLQGTLRIQENKLIFNSYRTTVRLEIEDLKEIATPLVWSPNHRYHSTVGKVLRKVLGPDTFHERDICKFSEEYFNLIVVEDNNHELEIVEGKDITKYYHSDTYAPSNHSQLWNSCMRYSNCQSYFRIYEENPEHCKMAVLFNRYQQVVARSIVWYVEGKKYFDRIYYHNNKANAILLNLLESNGFVNLRKKSPYGRIDGVDIRIPALHVEELLDEDANFPYIDTLSIYLTEERVLTNFEVPGQNFITFRSTSGSYTKNYNDNEEADEPNTFNCACCGYDAESDEACYVERGRYSDYTLCTNCAIWSEADQTYILQEEAVEDIYGDYILRDDALHVYPKDNLGIYKLVHEDDCYLRRYENNHGFFLTNENPSGYTFDYYEDEDTGLFYHPSDPNNPVNLTNIQENATIESIEQPVEQPIEQTNNNSDNSDNSNNSELFLL